MGLGEPDGKGDRDRKRPDHVHDDGEDLDAVLASLEEEDDSAYRAQRLQQLHTSATHSKPTTAFDTVKKSYVTLKSDDEALNFTTENERAVVHFFHTDFARCNTMDDHCQQIAQKHAELADGDVSFARIDVKDAPFVVEKLGVRVLPCVIGFVKGVVKGKVTGFEGLCWDGKEGSLNVTRALEETLVSWTVLRKRLLLGHDDDDEETDDENDNYGRDNGRSARKGIRDRQQRTEDDDDDEWD
ncbi:hypothetical protein A1O3_08263 [Capronia epimyces CBS 606.96]|uniref:Thioredoxin domain-containing protein n=1 Tax=Capronia epimyces CBS 606.96 TaxID=1182542 RepID=W9XHJ2_9EURO|nr:uncharacterized protein A1O3_08263 [Capronia epimyces CBS 606.96]EXJ79977.1 hypothetical protein A1O3_08263 [Capronia epimyces CBS 606.96]